MSTASYANSAFEAANSAGSYANSAFITANTANAAINTKTTINALNFLSAPSSNTLNTVFLVVDLQTGTPTTRKMSLSVLSERSANFAFQAANSAGSYANAAFAAANSAGGAADQRAVTSGSYANSAFVHANAAFSAANSASGAAAASSYANSAFVAANSAGSYANSAFIHANAAFTAANSASSGAAGSYANSAFQTANSAGSYANSAFIHANSSFGAANVSANLALSFGATTILEVTHSGSAAYLFSQYDSLNNPNVSAFSATTIGFKLNVTGHPFQIRLGNNTANFDTGLVHVSPTGTLSYGSAAQGQVDGTLFWRIPHNSVGNYKYRCTNHPGVMIGEINVANTAGIYLAYNT